MDAPVRNGTPRPDTVVEMAKVWKTYRQTQRSGRLGDAIRGLIRPDAKRVEALRGIDLTVRRGEIVAYAGPNGAGKSTTVKLLAGLLAADSGTVRVLGMDPIRDRVRYVGRIGVVFGQRSELWWDHSVAASYEWKRVVWDVPDATYRRMLALVNETLGVAELSKTLARELSLGQRMRADLGMALLHDPEVLFLDEPTLGLDVLAKRRILQCIKDLNRERAMSVMVTSHDMSDLEQLAGRIVIVHRGAIAYDGDFETLRKSFTERRSLTIETEDGAPALRAATLVRSEGGRHEYAFDSAHTTIASLLDEASAQCRILDVETHRPPIDDVIADIYERWASHASPPAPLHSGGEG